MSILVTCLWAVWGVSGMFHEGWYAPFEWLFFLLPAGATLALTLIALRWPRVGAVLFVALGLGFGGFVLWQYRPRGGRAAGWTLVNLLSWVPVTLFLAFVGGLFYRGRRQERRRAHYLIAVGAPLLLGLALAVGSAYRVAHRVDDGHRGARLIEGNGVSLVWAPKGPGWNWKQPWGGYPSWDMLALYGVPPVGFGNKPGYENCHAAAEDMERTGLCRYLSADGLTLMAKPQDIWRMPTTDEIVRSLVRSGQNAGSVWDGESDAPCTIGSPGDSAVGPGHGYRCVREPAGGD